MKTLLNRLFGCRHYDIGTPVTIKNKTTVFCRGCGARIEYDWANMRQGQVIQERKLVCVYSKAKEPRFGS